MHLKLLLSLLVFPEGNLHSRGIVPPISWSSSCSYSTHRFPFKNQATISSFHPGSLSVEEKCCVIYRERSLTLNADAAYHAISFRHAFIFTLFYFNNYFILLLFFFLVHIQASSSSPSSSSSGDLSSYKRVAVVENFYDIIYNVHVEMDGRSGKHAGQKRTYRAVCIIFYTSFLR